MLIPSSVRKKSEEVCERGNRTIFCGLMINRYIHTDTDTQTDPNTMLRLQNPRYSFRMSIQQQLYFGPFAKLHILYVQ